MINMNEQNLSCRLAAIAAFIPNDCSVADIGSDHAYLPLHLAMHKNANKLIAGEVNEGPYQAAKHQVKRLQLGHMIDVRKGDGLDVIETEEVNVVVIAGMGGPLICSILERGLDKLKGIDRLVLQPNVAGHIVRRWLYEHNWPLTAETIIKEDGKVYEVLLAESRDSEQPYQQLSCLAKERAILMGPYLLQEKSDAFCYKWRLELEKRYKICQSLHKSLAEDSTEKRMQLEKEIRMIEEVL